jgi:hypothetical protein
MNVAINGEIFLFHSCENETWCPHLRLRVESKVIINISENPDAAVFSKPDNRGNGIIHWRLPRKEQNVAT